MPIFLSKFQSFNQLEALILNDYNATILFTKTQRKTELSLNLYLGAQNDHLGICFDLSPDYRHTMTKSLILCGPNSNFNPKYRFICDLNIKAYSAENTPNAPNIFDPVCLPKPKSRFSKKS